VRAISCHRCEASNTLANSSTQVGFIVQRECVLLDASLRLPRMWTPKSKLENVEQENSFKSFGTPTSCDHVEIPTRKFNFVRRTSFPPPISPMLHITNAGK